MVNFFIYLMCWVPRPGQPAPTFEDIMAIYVAEGITMKAAIVVAALGIVRSAYLLVLTLIWNHDAFAVFHKTEARIAMRNSNTDTQALAFVGLLCVPGLWEILEYLSLLALIAFLPIAVAL